MSFPSSSSSKVDSSKKSSKAEKPKSGISPELNSSKVEKPAVRSSEKSSRTTDVESSDIPSVSSCESSDKSKRKVSDKISSHGSPSNPNESSSNDVGSELVSSSKKGKFMRNVKPLKAMPFPHTGFGESDNCTSESERESTSSNVDVGSPSHSVDGFSFPRETKRLMNNFVQWSTDDDKPEQGKPRWLSQPRRTLHRKIILFLNKLKATREREFLEEYHDDELGTFRRLRRDWPLQYADLRIATRTSPMVMTDFTYLDEKGVIFIKKDQIPLGETFDIDQEEQGLLENFPWPDRDYNFDFENVNSFVENRGLLALFCETEDFRVLQDHLKDKAKEFYEQLLRPVPLVPYSSFFHVLIGRALYKRSLIYGLNRAMSKICLETVDIPVMDNHGMEPHPRGQPPSELKHARSFSVYLFLQRASEKDISIQDKQKEMLGHLKGLHPYEITNDYKEALDSYMELLDRINEGDTDEKINRNVNSPFEEGFHFDECFQHKSSMKGQKTYAKRVEFSEGLDVAKGSVSANPSIPSQYSSKLNSGSSSNSVSISDKRKRGSSTDYLPKFSIEATDNSSEFEFDDFGPNYLEETYGGSMDTFEEGQSAQSGNDSSALPAASSSSSEKSDHKFTSNRDLSYAVTARKITINPLTNIPVSSEELTALFKQFDHNKSQLSKEAGNDSIFHWLSTDMQRLVRDQLEVLILSNPKSNLAGSNTLDRDVSNSFLNWSQARIRNLVCQALCGTEYTDSGEDILRSHQSLAETVTVCLADKATFQSCLNCCQAWGKFFRPLQTALAIKNQLLSDSDQRFDAETIRDHARCIKLITDALRDAAKKFGNTYEGWSGIMSDYDDSMKSKESTVSLYSFCRDMQCVLLTAETRAKQVSRYPPIIRQMKDNLTDAPRLKKQKQESETIAVITQPRPTRVTNHPKGNNQPKEAPKLSRRERAKQKALAEGKPFVKKNKPDPKADPKKDRRPNPKKDKADKKEEGEHSSIRSALMVICHDSKTLSNLVLMATYSNNAVCEIVYKQATLKVRTLVDTGAIAGNYIDSQAANWLISQGYQAIEERSKICSCLNECTVASRRIFDIHVNNEALNAPLFLRFVELDSQFQMIIGLNDTMRHGLTKLIKVNPDRQVLTVNPAHPLTLIESRASTSRHTKQVTAPTLPQLSDQPSLFGKPGRKTAGYTEVATVYSTASPRSGLATDNLKSVTLSPQSTGMEEQCSSIPVCMPCGDDRKVDRSHHDCSLCTLRLSKEDLLTPEPDGDEIDGGAQADLFDVFPDERPTLAGPNKSPNQLPPPDHIFGSEELRAKILSLCERYRAVFSTTVHKSPARVPPMQLSVDSAKWKIPASRRAPRRQSVEKQEALKEDLDMLLALGVIRHSTALHASQVLLVKKKPFALLGMKQAWRMTIDYRELNACSSPEQWPLPNIRELLERIGSHRPKYFGILDMTSGYWQAPIAEQCRAFTAFTTTLGNFEWCRVPMGLKSACAYFQRVLSTVVLRDIFRRIVESYLDDLIVFGRTEEEFLTNLEALFTRLIEFNVTLNPNKCRLGLETIEYVGHTISSTGTHFSREKIASVQQFAMPTTLKGLKSFLGLTNYFRDHIRNYAEITHPLNELSNGKENGTNSGYRPNRQIVLSNFPGCLESFEATKAAIRDCPALFFIDDHSPVTVQTDASEIGFGAYGFQTVTLADGSKVDRPIQILSKCWSGGQKNWSVPEKECYTIFHALKEWEYLLRDSHFTLMTDHKNLIYVNHAGSPKVKRWKLLIQEYDFDILHIKGKDNTVADLLSRLCPISQNDDEETADELMFISEYRRLCEYDEDEAYTEDLIGRFHVMAISSDPVSLPQGIYDAIKSVHNPLAGHCGVQRTLQKLRVRGDSSLNGLTARQLQDAVKQFISECAYCQKSDYRSVKIVSKPYTLSHQKVMNFLTMDAIGPFLPDSEGYQHVLVLTDTFTRFTMLFALKSLLAKEAAHALFFHIGIFGAPAEISSDGGTQLVNDVLDELLFLTGTDHEISIAYSSQRNAIVERRNSEVNEHLRAFINDRNSVDDWHLWLPFVQRILNAEVVQSIGVAPARILFGEAIDLDRAILKPNRVCEYHEVDQKELTEHTKRLIKAQQVAIELAKEVQTRVDDRHIVARTKAQPGPQTEFAPNSYVLVSYPDKGLGAKPPNKSLTANAGPFKVVSARNDGNEYELENLRTGKTELHPVNRLRPFRYDKERTNPMAEAIKDGLSAGSSTFIVERIDGHRGGGRQQSADSLQFLVKEVGIPEPFYVPWKNMRTNKLAHTYMENTPALRRFIPERFRKAKAVDPLNPPRQKIPRVETVQPPVVLDENAIPIPLTRARRAPDP